MTEAGTRWELGDGGKNGGVLYGFQGARRVTARYPSSLIQGGISGILWYLADGRVKYLVFCLLVTAFYRCPFGEFGVGWG